MLRVGAGPDAGLAALLVHLAGRALPQGCGRTAAQVRRPGPQAPAARPAPPPPESRSRGRGALPAALPSTHSTGWAFASGRRAGRPGCSGVSTRTGWHRHSCARLAGRTQPGPPGSSAGTAPWARRTRRTPGPAAGRRCGPGQRAARDHGVRPQPTPRVLTWKAGSSGLRDPVRPGGLVGWPHPGRRAPAPHVHAPPAGRVAWGWPRRHRSRWGRPACARRRTRGVPGVGLGVWDGSGSAPQDGRTGPGPHPHLPSSPRKSLVASPSKFPQSPHTWPLCLFSSSTCGRVGRAAHARSGAPSTLALLAVTTLPAPPGASFSPGSSFSNGETESPVTLRPIQQLAGVTDKSQELGGGRDPHPMPGPALHPARLQSRPLHPISSP